MRRRTWFERLLWMPIYACLAFAPLSASAQTVAIDFDSFAAMDYISRQPIPETARLSNQLATTYGVVFSAGSGYVAVVNLGVGHATSGTNGIGGSTPEGILTYDRQWPVVLRFVDPLNPDAPGITDFVSIRADLWGGGQSVELNAYDEVGRLVASMTTTDSGGETLTVSGPRIHRVEFLGTQDDGGVALDDLRFHTVTSIPISVEPTSWTAEKQRYR